MLIDAHVHLYPRHDVALCLDHAAGNFTRVASRLNEPASSGVLMLAETAADDRFAQLRACADGGQVMGRWRFEQTDEAASLRALRDDGATLVLVAGRQIITAEGLEVLALATAARLDDGVPIEQAVAAARQVGAVVVLPYGVGKWLGRRGRIVRDLLARSPDETAPLLLGDNGNRCGGLPLPRLLAHARREGPAILPGSDPLPLPGQERRLGSYGFTLDLDPDAVRPAEQLRTRLLQLTRSPRWFGRLTGPLAFLRAQLAMQRRKRRR